MTDLKHPGPVEMVEDVPSSGLVQRLREAADEVMAFPHPSSCDHLHVAHAVMREAAHALDRLAAECRHCHGTGVDGDVNDRGETVDIPCAFCNGSGHAPAGNAQTFQQRVYAWVAMCFDGTIANDRVERNHRFLEEALELVQSLGCTEGEAQQLVSYVYARPTGVPSQEVGGVYTTLAALCSANQMMMLECAEAELTRISAPAMIERIRAKQAAKPKNSPLPMHQPSPDEAMRKDADLWPWRHVKTGRIYEHVAHALREHDQVPMVVYRATDEAARVWVRPAVEFYDGRFQRMSPRSDPT